MIPSGPRAHLDFETASNTDLIRQGLHRYVEDPIFRVWGFRYRIGQGPVREWRPGYPEPTDLLIHITLGGVVVAHNAAFERWVWNVIICQRYCPHWPELSTEQQDCTLARAAAMALPLKLEKLGEVLGTVVRKDKEGQAAMRKAAKPRKINADGTVVWWDAPDLVDRIMSYCGDDVLMENEIDDKLPPLEVQERALWELDQEINDRGIAVDVKLITRATNVVDLAKKWADREMRRVTNGAVRKCTEVSKLVDFIASRGVDCTSVSKGNIDDILFLLDLKSDTQAKEAIELRRNSAKSSTAKYATALKCVCHDNRVRGLLGFHVASTGRWGGRLLQPQNYPRLDYEEHGARIEFLHKLMFSDMSDADVLEHIEITLGNPMKWLSLMLRSTFVAAEGHRFLGGDYSNIEGRVNAWLAGEIWKIKAFSDFDAGIGADLYKLAYARSFGVDVETVGKGQKRQIGKVQELALGYQGSIGAYLTMGDTYGVNPYDLTGPVMDATSAEQWDRTAAKYHQKGTNRYQLFEPEWTALKVLVDNWRSAHPAIVQSWWDLQDAAINAVQFPGTVVPVLGGKIQYLSDGEYLYCCLPSGRVLSYSQPELHSTQVEYTDKNGEVRTRTKWSVSFWGTDSKTKQWCKRYLYGGLQCENIVQATARDIMRDAMLRLRAAGYQIVLTVHDEILNEMRYGVGSVSEFSRLMSILPPWAQGLPVAVSAWEDTRYVK